MTNYFGGISKAEIEDLPVRHPLRSVAFAGHGAQVSANTQMASKLVAQKNPQWLTSLKPRLLDVTDQTNASSALGELRAYGALLETWMGVKPGPVVTGSNVSPEFEVAHGDGPVIVEVHSRQLDADQTVALAEHRQALEAQHADSVQKAKAEEQKGNVVTTGVAVVHPYGAPKVGKEGDTVATNAISRIASVKGKEHQIDPSKPFVLWLDLQDTMVWGLPVSEEHFSPVYTEAKEGEIAPGNYWSALYGRKGDPLLISKGYSYSSMPMAHEGRFYQTIKGGPSRVSAFVFALPRATVLMENPNAPCPLTPKFRAAMLKAPFFRLDLSLLDWEPGTVAAIVAAQRQALLSAEKALKSFDPIST
jgi:hypothetical protein